MLHPAPDYETLRRDFRWDVPTRLNMAVDCCDRHADGTGRLALIVEAEDGAVSRHSFDDIKLLSNQFAHVLARDGLVAGDRMAILLPQALETGVAHLSAWKSGLISIPLFTLFGEDALEFRLANSGARAVVTDAAGAAKLAPLRDRLPALAMIYVIDGAPPGCVDFHSATADMPSDFTPLDTGPDDPAVIIYTSGTTGNPKGALHAHRVLLGHLPVVELSHDFFPQPGDLFWTPADWAWIGGLFDVLMPAWFHAVPVLAHRARKFEPAAALDLMARHRVRNTFLPPTALKLIRQSGLTHPGLALRSVASGGETLGASLLEWAEQIFGTVPNEFYGQTECNVVACNDARLFPVRPGSLGRPGPGHDVQIVDEAGQPVPVGEIGDIGVRKGDPVMFLRYWNNPAATAAKFAGAFLLTGDRGRQDAEGYIWFVGRADNLITSAGYRIGPSEIEDCLVKHPAVAMAAVVGVPDPVRTELVKAWIVLRPEFAPDDGLARDIQDFVKIRLAAHEYPRLIAFVDALPMTATGKIIHRELRARG
jgi:acetyl-CoA synthetase